MSSKKQLTFEEYKKLSDEEKGKRYVELTNNNKFIARTSCYIQPVTIGHMEVTEVHRLGAISEREKINEYLNNFAYYK